MATSRVQWISSVILGLMVITVTLGEVTIVEQQSDTVVLEEEEFLNLKCASPAAVHTEWVYEDPDFGDIAVMDVLPIVLSAMQSASGRLNFLTIEGVSSMDAGTYKCRDVANWGDSDSINLVVHSDSQPQKPSDWVTPQFDRTSAAAVMEVEVGKELMLKCIGGARDSVLEILFNQEAIDEDTHTYITTARDLDTSKISALLTRRPAEMLHSGVYTCRDAKFPTDVDTISVNVITEASKQVEIVEPSGNSHEVTAGVTFHLKCRADISASIEWRHNDHVLEDQKLGYIITVQEDRTAGVVISTLTKEDTNTGDGGSYYCVNADSTDDVAEIQIDVEVEGDDVLNTAALQCAGVPTGVALAVTLVFALICY